MSVNVVKRTDVNVHLENSMETTVWYDQFCPKLSGPTKAE